MAFIVCFSPQDGKLSSSRYLHSLTWRYSQWKACTDLSRCSSKHKHVNRISSILPWFHFLGVWKLSNQSQTGQGKRPWTNLSTQSLDKKLYGKKKNKKKTVFLLSHNLVPVVQTGKTGLATSDPAWVSSTGRKTEDSNGQLPLCQIFNWPSLGLQRNELVWQRGRGGI